MENQNFNEWIKVNPGKNINDYYKSIGASFNKRNDLPANKVSISTKIVDESSAQSEYKLISFRISVLRLFMYTGIAMASSVLWIFIFWGMFVIIFGTNIIRDVLLGLFK